MVGGCGCGGNGLPLVFACSGASDVGAITDQVARKLSRRRLATMSCIAAIGGRVEEMVEKAQAANSIIAIDGCEHECARRTLESVGVVGMMHFTLQELGMEKGNTPVSTENVDKVYDSIVQVLRGVS
ncbi:MAG: hypothetical protein AMXMBFR61_01230 [Fimbriimonadales bacterium]